MHSLSNVEKEKWIKDYADRETAVARKRVEDAETAIEQEHQDIRNAEQAGLTTTKPKRPTEEMLNSTGDSLSNLASSDDGEDGENKPDNSEDPELGRLSEDEEPSSVMGKISTTVQH